MTSKDQNEIVVICGGARQALQTAISTLNLRQFVAKRGVPAAIPLIKSLRKSTMKFNGCLLVVEATWVSIEIS